MSVPLTQPPATAHRTTLTLSRLQAVAILPHPLHRELLPHVGNYVPRPTTPLDRAPTKRPERALSRSLRSAAGYDWRGTCWDAGDGGYKNCVYDYIYCFSSRTWRLGAAVPSFVPPGSAYSSLLSVRKGIYIPLSHSGWWTLVNY